MTNPYERGTDEHELYEERRRDRMAQYGEAPDRTRTIEGRLSILGNSDEMTVAIEDANGVKIASAMLTAAELAVVLTLGKASVKVTINSEYLK